MDRNTAIILGIIAGIGALAYYTFAQGSANFPGSDVIGGIVDAVMGKLSAAQIAAYASQAGFQGEDLATAVAVALAESGGNPSAYNPETAAGTPQGQGSYGLWQIYLKAHPEFAGWNLNDPATNAQAAYSVFTGAGSSFNPWATYNPEGTQPYLAFLPQGESAAQNV